jgi:hypothetical protein
VREAFEPRYSLPVDVVVDNVAVLYQEAKDGDHVLGDVPYRDQQRAPRAVGAPGIVPLHVGLFGWDVEPTVRELAYAASVGFQDGIEVRRSIGRLLDQRGGVAGLEEVDALIVGEEDLAGVKACGRGKSATPRCSRIVR